MFNDSLYDANQLLTLLSSSLITLSLLLDSIVSTQQLHVVSSAHIIHWKGLLAVECFFLLNPYWFWNIKSLLSKYSDI